LVTSQWLLARVAEAESRLYECTAFGEERFKMLAYIAKQRAQLERSFRTAIEDMKQSQKARPSRPQPKPAQTAQTAKAAPASQPDIPPPPYVMSESGEDVFGTPAASDTR